MYANGVGGYDLEGNWKAGYGAYMAQVRASCDYWI